MFAKSFAVACVLAISLQANAHCIINPALGVTGTPARSDVQRPSTASECGTVNVASAVATTTPVAAGSGGAFTVTAQNFNTGEDGSREITSAKVDTTATGQTFAGAATITTNGILAPTDVSTQPIVFSLPAGTTCAGGADKKSCLVSFTTAGGFGNCVLVTQGAAGSTAAANTTAATPPVAGANVTATPPAAANTTTTTPAAGTAKGKGKHAKGAKAAGTRRARALLASLEARGEESIEMARRGVSWIWAA